MNKRIRDGAGTAYLCTGKRPLLEEVFLYYSLNIRRAAACQPTEQSFLPEYRGCYNSALLRVLF